MKKSTLLVTAGVLLIAAATLLPEPGATSGKPATPSGMPTKSSRRSHAVNEAPPPSSGRLADDGEAANLAAWRDRLDALLAEGRNRDDAIRQVLQEIDDLYHAWVSDQLVPVVGRPPGDRYDELADIGQSVSEGTAIILDQLGIAESRCLDAALRPAELLDAEVQYAEAARDSDSRLALLRLDRERQSRLEQALALTDEAAKSQALAELDAWYDAGLGGIFAQPDSGTDDAP